MAFADYSTAVLALSGITSYWPLDEVSGTAFEDDAGSRDGTYGADVSGFLTTGPDGVAQAPVNNGTANRVANVTAAFQPPATATWFWWQRHDTVANDDGMAFEWANSPTFSHYVQMDYNYSGLIAGVNGFGIYAFNYGNGAGSGQCFIVRATVGDWMFNVVTLDPALATVAPLKSYVNTVHTGVPTTSFSQSGLTPASGFLGIMGRNNNGTRQLPIKAAVCGVGLLNRVMTAAEMRTLHEAMLTGKHRYPYTTPFRVTEGAPIAPGPEVYDAFVGVQRTTGNDLIAVYYKGTSHLSGDGRIFAIDRKSGVWQNARQIVNTGFDDRDPGLFKRTDGTLLCTFSTVTDPNVPTDNKARMMKSTDNGVTWTNMSGGSPDASPTRVDGTFLIDKEVVGSRIEDLPDGTLLCPVYGQDVATTGDWYTKILRSLDGGTTWDFLASIHDTGFHYEEPHLFRFPDGTLWCTLRKAPNPAPADNMSTQYQIAKSVSGDDGATWGPVTNMFPGISIAHVFLVGEGDMIALYRDLGPHHNARRSVYRTSWDRGATWSAPMQVGIAGHEYGDIVEYHQTEASDGRIAFVWGEDISTVDDGLTSPGGARLYYQELTKPYVTQRVRSDADVTTTGWTATPLFSKVNDQLDSSVISATAA